MIALDSAGHPSPESVKASDATFLGQYVGTRFQAYGVSRAQLDAYHAAGVPILPIFEEWGNQFLGGYDTGRAMIARMCDSSRALGLTPGVDYEPAVALVDPSPSPVHGGEAQLTAFARGIQLELVDQGVSRWRGYGSKYGLVDVVRASGVAPGMIGLWGVRTWGFTDSFEAGCDFIQEPNISAPVEGCDYNSVFTVDCGQWPRPTPTPPIEEPEMFVLKAGSGAAYITDGLTKRYIGDPAELGFWAAAGVKEIAAGDDVLARIPDYATLEGTPLVVPPLAATSSATAKNMANVLRKTTIGKK